MTILYGISNCDTVRKARRWLEAHAVAYRFHDLRADGLTAEKLAEWSAALGWEALLNRRSTSWRQLDPKEREGLNGEHALALMLACPTLIRRPVLEHQGRYLVGFSEDEYQKLTQ